MISDNPFLNFINNLITETERRDFEEDEGKPHVLLCFDPEADPMTTIPSVVGPYADKMTALVAAEEYANGINEGGKIRVPFRVTVARIFTEEEDNEFVRK